MPTPPTNRMLAGVAALSAATVAVAQVPFTSEHSARGVIYNMTLSPPFDMPQEGYGMAIADLDGDDDLDLVLTGRADGLIGIFENTGAGAFINRSAVAGTGNALSAQGVSAFDHDRDGDLDLFIAQRHHPCRFLRNDGGMAFTDRSASSGLGFSAMCTGTSVADIDGDGWLDLHVCTYQVGTANRLYRNRGDGTFEDVAPSLGVASLGLSYQSTFADVDADGWPDLAVSNDRGFDPQRDVDRYERLAAQHGLRIVATAETHIHADFLSGSRELAEKGAHVYVSDEGDADWKYQWLQSRTGGGAYAHTLLKDGDSFMVGNIRLTAMHTPGHTPEHLCYLVTDLGGGATEPMGVASGDFMFVGDLGRPDLLGAGKRDECKALIRELIRQHPQFPRSRSRPQGAPASGRLTLTPRHPAIRATPASCCRAAG